VARELAAEWDLNLGPPFALSRYSYVAPAGELAVLKVRHPDDDESNEEADAFELWGGNGSVRLLRRDDARRALLIERALPGTDISTVAEEDAVSIAIEVGKRLWQPANAPFRWIGDHVPRWLDEAEQGRRASESLTPLARRLYAALDVGRSTLVHGDFHHHNILDAAGRYIAIDPKPMLGEPEFDVPSFLWNPLGSRMTHERTERRLAAFAAAGLDDRRMRAWTVIRGAYLRTDRAEVDVIGTLL